MSFNSYECRVHSQNGEDGLIQHIFNTIGEKHKTSVEFGFGSSEANTLNLLLNKGWNGWLFDSNPTEVCIALLQHALRPQIRIGNVAFTRDNINSEFEKAGVPHEIDLLSIDVDGVDWHLWNALTWTRPRVAVVEYNADFGVERSIAVKYHDGFNRHNFHPQYHGASLKALTSLALLKGMKLVGTDTSGINAFYIAMNEPFTDKSVEEAYHPNNRAHWRGMIDRFREQFGFEEILVCRT